MKCKNCGAEIPNDATECPYCDAAIVVAKQPVQQVQNQAAVQPPVQSQQEAQPVVEESVVGKEYSFSSVRGTNLAGFINSKIVSNVKLGDDRAYINITPKRFNKAPAVMYDDIMGVDISSNINLYYIFLIILALFSIAAISFGGLILAAIVYFIGLQYKITISQRNGLKVVMYTESKVAANAFKEDIKKVSKIQ
jgi:hypothetical protein